MPANERWRTVHAEILLVTLSSRFGSLMDASCEALKATLDIVQEENPWADQSAEKAMRSNLDYYHPRIKEFLCVEL